MKMHYLNIAVVGLLALLLLSGCEKDGDGKLEVE